LVAVVVVAQPASHRFSCPIVCPFSDVIRNYPAMRQTVFESLVSGLVVDGEDADGSGPGDTGAVAPIIGLDFRGGRMDLGGINGAFSCSLSHSRLLALTLLLERTL